MPFRIQLRPSFILASLLAFMYGGAMYWVWVFGWPLILALTVTVVLVICAGITASRHVLFRGSKSVSSMVCEDGENWSIETLDGQRLAGTLISGTCFQPWLVVMSFKVEGKFRPWSLVLMKDSTDSTTFRRLQVKLRALNSY